MKALFLSPEAPYPPHGGGPMRSACVLEWLAERFEVYALQFRVPSSVVRESWFVNRRNTNHDSRFTNHESRFRRVAWVELPAHSGNPAARVWRNLGRAARGIPPLVDRFFCPPARGPLESLLEAGPFELAVFEHFWSAPWVELVRPHCRTAILDLHNREPEFCRALGGPLAAWFARCARQWEARLLPWFDQVWDTDLVPTGLPLEPRPENERTFDVAFSGTLAYPPNRDALEFFFARIWPRIVARRPSASCVLIGKNPEAAPRRAARDPRVLVTGPVEDAVDWLGRARVAVAPLRRGAGMSVKIAEAWAAGCAVVATPLGARGYCGTGRHVATRGAVQQPGAGSGPVPFTLARQADPAPLGARASRPPTGGPEARAPRKACATDREALTLADSPEEFAAEVLGLLEDETRREKLARAGRCRFEDAYCWPAVHARMDALVAPADPAPEERQECRQECLSHRKDP